MYMNSVCFQFKNKAGVFFLYICKNNSFIIVFFSCACTLCFIANSIYIYIFN